MTYARKKKSRKIADPNFNEAVRELNEAKLAVGLPGIRGKEAARYCTRQQVARADRGEHLRRWAEAYRFLARHLDKLDITAAGVDWEFHRMPGRHGPEEHMEFVKAWVRELRWTKRAWRWVRYATPAAVGRRGRWLASRVRYWVRKLRGRR